MIAISNRFKDGRYLSAVEVLEKAEWSIAAV